MNRIKFWTFILACMALHACGGGGAPISDDDNPALPDDPTSIELLDPSSSPGTDATPTLKVSGVTSGDKISIFTNSLCKDAIKSVTANAKTIEITLSALSDGTYHFYTNAENDNGVSACVGPVDYILDTHLPSVLIDSPSATLITTGDVTYDVTYTNASSVNLTESDVTVHTTGTVTYSTDVTDGTTSTPIITVAITGGDGTIDSIDIAAGTSSDSTGNMDSGDSEPTDVVVDNTAPTMNISAPSTLGIGTGDVNYDVTYTGASTINLLTGNVTVHTTGTVGYTLGVTGGTTSTPTITVTITNGDGTIDSIDVSAGTSTDVAGNLDVGDSETTDVTIDNIIPTVSIGAPSTTIINTGDIDYDVTYTGASTINLTAADVTVNKTGSVTFTKNITNGTTSTPTITVTITGGNGTIDSVAIAAGTSSDGIGNLDTGNSIGTDVIVDNSPPTVIISTPSTTLINLGFVIYNVTYAGASTINLTAADVTVNVTGTVTYMKSVSHGTTSTPIIQIQVTGGDGTIDSVVIASAKSSDAAGNTDAGDTDGTDVVVDSTAVTVSIDQPSVSVINIGDVTYEVQYAGATSINLTTGDITVNTTGSIIYTTDVTNGTTSTPTITVSITGGDGTIESIDIAAATSNNGIGGFDAGASEQTDIIVDNTPPSILIGSPSLSIINMGDVDYAVTYTGASTINLTTGDITVNVTGSVTYLVSVTNGTTSTPTITVAITGGDGSIDSIVVDASTSSDEAGNADAGSSETTDVMVDNTLPTITNDALAAIQNSNKTNYSISGSCSNDDDTVSITSPVSIIGSVSCSSGVFNISGLNVSGLPDGIVNFTLKVQDAALNMATDTDSTLKDTVTPTISGISLSSPATSPGNDSTPTILVTGVFAIGDLFTLYSDMTCTTPVSAATAAAAPNTVNITTTTLLADGPYTFFAGAADTAGNTTCNGVSSVAYTLDTIPPTITITEPMTFITNANKANYSFSGTCAADGDSISITAPAGVSGTTSCASGAFTFSGKNVTAQADGTVVFTVQISDTAGNAVSDSANATKDIVSPTVIITSPMTNINTGNETNYSFSGSCTADGDSISILAPASISGTVLCSSGTFTFSGKDVSGESEGTVNFTVQISDAVGNTASDSDSAIKDISPPTDPACVSVAGDATPTKSDTATWTGSTDVGSGINRYEMSIGISAAADTVDWTNIGATVTPYQFTGLSPKLLFNTDYTIYLRAVDNGSGVSNEVACPVWHLKTGYGNFTGTQSTAPSSSTTLNQSTAYALKYSADSFHPSYFTHSTVTNSQNITITEPGNYLLSHVLPLTRVNGNTTSTVASASSTIKVNGTAITTGLAANSFTRGKVSGVSYPLNGSNYIMVPLQNLAANDVITIETKTNATTETMKVPVGSNFSTYLELIPDEADIFTGTSVATTSGTNLNVASARRLTWTESIKDASSFTHSDATNSQNITLVSGGDYFVAVNLPFTLNKKDMKVSADIYINGVSTNQSASLTSQNGYISNLNSHSTSSTGFANVLYNVPAGAILDVRTVRLGNSGTVVVTSGKKASIYIQKLDTSTDYFVSTGSAGVADWNTTLATSIPWDTDHVIDASLFTHTPGTDSITIEADGDYFVTVSDKITSSTDFVSPVVRLKVNGTSYPGAECSAHNLRTNYTGSKNPNCSIQVLMQGLSMGDILTFTTEKDTVSGTVTGSAPRITIRRLTD